MADETAERATGMTIGSDALGLIKKIFLVSEELTRLSTEVKELTRQTNQHDIRLAVIENSLSIARRSSKLILPGN